MPSYSLYKEIASYINEPFGWRLSSGKDHIECESETEAEYLKIWLESGLEETEEDFAEVAGGVVWMRLRKRNRFIK